MIAVPRETVPPCQRLTYAKILARDLTATVKMNFVLLVLPSPLSGDNERAGYRKHFASVSAEDNADGSLARDTLCRIIPRGLAAVVPASFIAF